MALLVSGGHTELNLMTDHLTYKRLGGTTDDAAGEAFDKVARLLSLPYPGGPSIQKVSVIGDPKAFTFPTSATGGHLGFFLQRDQDRRTAGGTKVGRGESAPAHRRPGGELPGSGGGYAFTKTMDAARKYQVKEIVVAGGVSANKALREAFLGSNRVQSAHPASIALHG